ncbi:GlxA family transcriptional regulator [Thermobifida halotolerans]|uniref:GlxA family transcriptional regulator n=1 Tax=Thermobifida halotolerans TaxID=483545 RepID=A0AA97M3A5_9ACTN|nr:GlxA family transcriptional regulator [Thermobifida halotolerans]UOE18953.1 GlxA family transcriptional regulator [Thermobifida halotolerans]
MPNRRVLIVLFEGVQSLDVTGPLEVFTGADRYVAANRSGVRGYEVVTASLGGTPVRTSSGLRVAPDADLAHVPVPHTLVVPGGDGTRVPHSALVAWLRVHAHRAERLVSVCTGAFLLAEAGLLDGRRATTHWNHCASLAARFPRIRVDPDPIFVRDGRVTTSAGVTAGIDLSLALVEEDLGREAALTVARHLVVFLRRPGGQAQFSSQLQAQTARREPLRELQGWINDHPGADLSVEALAERAGLSPRQFARVFTAETGVTPGRYVDRIRLEAARRLLEDSTDGIARIARRCGYGTPEAMRRAFLRALDVSPAEYRRRFHPSTTETTERSDRADRRPALRPAHRA